MRPAFLFDNTSNNGAKRANTPQYLINSAKIGVFAMADHLEFFCESCGEHLRVPGGTATNQSVKCPFCDSVAALPRTAVLKRSPVESPVTATEGIDPPRHRVSAITCLENAIRIFGVNFLLFGIGYLVVSALDGSPGIFVDSDEVTFGFSSIVLSLLSMFLSIGMIRATLHVARGGQADIDMVVSGAPYFWRVLLGNILFFFAAFLGFICLIIPGIYIVLTYWSFDHFIVDQDCDVIESFRRARRHAVGNRFAAFRLALLSLAVLLLGVLCFGVGLVVAIPVVSLMWTTAYLSMTGQAVVIAKPQLQPTVA